MEHPSVRKSQETQLQAVERNDQQQNRDNVPRQGPASWKRARRKRQDALLEPGLLSTFRLYVAVRLVFVLISVGFYVAWYRPSIGVKFFLLGCPFLADILILFMLLSWKALQQWLGRFFLPLALLISVLGPVFQVGYVLPVYGMDATFAFLFGFSLLLVPLILTAWQYSFGWVLLLGLSTSLLEFVLMSSTAEMSLVELQWSTVALVGRSLLAIFVGFVVSSLVNQQREQRRELARANQKLVRYATTLEQLAISRERNRLARELHDTLAHALSGLAVQLDAIGAVWKRMPKRARVMLERALSITRIGLDETRRALQDLRAAPLQDMGLALAISELAEVVSERSGLRLDLDVSMQISDLGPEIEQCYYRVAQEALENVLRHANAKEVSLSLYRDGQRLILEIQDDGLGFANDLSPQESRLGITGMHERAELIGGKLEIETQAGKGTVVRLTWEGKEHT